MTRLIWVCLVVFAAHVTAEDKSHWTYQGESGPEHWEELEQGSACAGGHQSPVNLIRVDSEPALGTDWPLTLHYPPSTHIHDILNNGHSIQYDFDQGDEIEFKGYRYALKQLHFHSPAEHTINGIRYPIEMHMVHFNEKLGRYTVLAIFGFEGRESAGYSFLGSYLPIAIGQQKIVDQLYDLSQILPQNLTPRFHYAGSLTTPPCTENVNWVIFEEPIMLSEHQVMLFREAMPLNNYRGTQPLNDRSVSLIVH